MKAPESAEARIPQALAGGSFSGLNWRILSLVHLFLRASMKSKKLIIGILFLATLWSVACKQPAIGPILGTGNSIWIVREELGEQVRTKLRYTDSGGYVWGKDETIKFALEYFLKDGKVIRVPCKATSEQSTMTGGGVPGLTSSHTIFEAVVPTRERGRGYRILQDDVIVRVETL